MQYLKEYQGFSVNLFDISRVFHLIGNGTTNKTAQLAETGFGINKIRALKEYLADFNLLREKDNLTELGRLIFKNDARFREPFTRWLLLYHWSSKANNPYLNFLVNHGAGISGDDKMLFKFKAWAAKNDVKTDYEGNMLAGMIRNTDNALCDSNGFLSLNFFSKEQGTMDRAEPFQVDALLTAYIFYLNRKKRTSISFSDLLREENNISKFFNLDRRGQDNEMVELNQLGLARLIQFADLNFIEYTSEAAPLTFVEKYYHEN